MIYVQQVMLKLVTNASEISDYSKYQCIVNSRKSKLQTALDLKLAILEDFLKLKICRLFQW